MLVHFVSFKFLLDAVKLKGAILKNNFVISYPTPKSKQTHARVIIKRLCLGDYNDNGNFVLYKFQVVNDSCKEPKRMASTKYRLLTSLLGWYAGCVSSFSTILHWIIFNIDFNITLNGRFSFDNLNITNNMEKCFEK